MKRIFFTAFVLLLSVFSCTVEHDWINWELTYINNTSHFIQIKHYYDRKCITNISLPKGESVVHYIEKEDQQGVFIIGSDSLFVIYDDTIAIRHYPDYEYRIKKI